MILSRFKPKLLIETREQTYSKVINFLKEFGYKIVKIDKSNIAAI